MKTADSLISAKQLAERLSVTPRTVQNYVAQRRIPSITLSPRCRRFNYAEVERALRNPRARF